jgi:uncharacterized protein
MLKVLNTDTLPATPWKNGGGKTREIARHEVDNALVWRISLADVANDGPFSHFPGLMRILTVIDGDGIDLHMPDKVIQARPGVPVQFSGDVPVNGRLTKGPIRDLNLIFDPSRIMATVAQVASPGPLTLGPMQTGFLVFGGLVTALGTALPKGAFALGTMAEINLGPGATGLLVRLHHLP